jgi:hypothetical protein
VKCFFSEPHGKIMNVISFHQSPKCTLNSTVKNFSLLAPKFSHLVGHLHLTKQVAVLVLATLGYMTQVGFLYIYIYIYGLYVYLSVSLLACFNGRVFLKSKRPILNRLRSSPTMSLPFINK